jgi:hypothetical protein
MRLTSLKPGVTYRALFHDDPVCKPSMLHMPLMQAEILPRFSPALAMMSLGQGVYPVKLVA